MSREPHLEQEAIERFSRLPLSPIALRILEVAKDKKAPAHSLAEVIATDSTLAARLLSLANFAPGLAQRLTTVSQAITALGLNTLKSLALGLTVFPFEPSAPHQDAPTAEHESPITLREMWEHTLGCAIVAGRFGARVDHGVRYQAFAAGFLHDIGRVLFYRYWKEGLFEALAVAQDKNIPSSEAETLSLGWDHLQVGERWSRMADLDPMLQCAIRDHHRSASVLSDLGAEQGKLATIVQLADSLCEAHEIGKGGDPNIVPSELWRMLNLQEAGHSEEIQIIKQEIARIRATFGFQQKELKRLPRVRRMFKPDGAAESSGPRGNRAAGKGRVIPFPSRSENASGAIEKRRDKKLTILVVEDHGSLCDMLSLYFMRYGYHVRTANDGQTALGILANEQIHLVLLDLMLPRMDGFAVLQRMREQRGDKPYVIVVSAGASTKDRSRVLELGANEYMPKPFHLVRLLERIQNVEKYLLT